MQRCEEALEQSGRSKACRISSVPQALAPSLPSRPLPPHLYDQVDNTEGKQTMLVQKAGLQMEEGGEGLADRTVQHHGGGAGGGAREGGPT